MEDKPESDKAEENENYYRMLASRSYVERIIRLEEMSKEAFREYLLPDGTWPPLKRVITIIKGTFKNQQ